MVLANSNILLTKEWIDRIVMGDEQAFNELFAAYRNKIYGYLIKTIKSKEIAEEATLDVFLKIWNVREALTEINNFDSFLFRVAYNKAIDYIRQMASDKKLQQYTQEQMKELAAQENTDSKLLKSETEQAIQKMVNRLPQQRQEAFRLSREELLSYDEIAERMNISRKTVRNHITAALSFLKDNLDKGSEITAILMLTTTRF